MSLPAQNPSTSPSQQRPMVLVVDDEELVRQVLAETLMREGYTVHTACDGIQALEQVNQHSYAVILSDNHMPRMRGLEFLTRAREIQPYTTRILITGVVDLDTTLEAINRGELYRFIIKPWVREELLVTLKNAAHRFELITENERLLDQTRRLNTELERANRELEKQLKRECEQNRRLDALNQALESNLQRSVDLCVRTLQTYYPSLGSQALRVKEACTRLAAGLQLAHDDRTTLEMAGQLCDIGLVGVPRALIKKWQRYPQSLEEAEQNLIRQHPALGEELTGFIANLKSVGPIIRSHHERFDGTGYPDGLAGESIPWLARLLSVVLSYVEGLERGTDALNVIKREAGKGLDPEAVRAFLRHGPGEFVSRGQKEVLLNELAPGMVLARGVYNAHGLLLIPEGQLLSRVFIDKLMNHHRVNPIRQSLLVYC